VARVSARELFAELLAESRLHGNALTALGATTRQYGGSALCFHTATETVHLGAATTVGLKRTLRHETLLLLFHKFQKDKLEV
jgi:hypothetical protein